VFSEDIEHRLDRSFGQLIEQATQREQEEVEGALASSARLSQQSIASRSALVVIVATLGVANVVILNRTILHPDRCFMPVPKPWDAAIWVTACARAPDELGALARSFNRDDRPDRQAARLAARGEIDARRSGRGAHPRASRAIREACAHQCKAARDRCQPREFLRRHQPRTAHPPDDPSRSGRGGPARPG
jgi:hypothetical protein